MESPFVSIGIPVYNGGEYLKECLDSVLHQNYTSWECCIVDNMSTDNSLEIACQYQKEDSRFKVFRNDNFLSLMENWNMTYSKLSKDSKYFKLLAADDWILPNYLSLMVELMEKNSDVGVCSSYRIDHNTVKCIGLDIYEGNIFEGNKIIEKELTNQISNVTGSVSTVFFRHSVVEKIDGYPQIYNIENLHIDTELAFDVLSISNFGFIYQVLSYTRRHNETATSKHIKYNTHLCGNEQIYFKFKNKSPLVEKMYKKLRLNYAYFLLKKKLSGDRECINWHRNNLPRPIRISEYLLAILKKASFQYV